jgi:gluconokinase
MRDVVQLAASNDAIVVVVMGVAGSGKTTVGAALAEALGWRFVDGDDYHPAGNVAKMARGEPLEDADRWPWLDRLRAIIVMTLTGEEPPLVLACSALRQIYRERLAGEDAGGRVRFVYLAGSPDLFRGRLARRVAHFMKPQMLDSQMATLEIPRDAITVDASLPLAEVVRQVKARLGKGEETPGRQGDAKPERK